LCHERNSTGRTTGTPSSPQQQKEKRNPVVTGKEGRTNREYLGGAKATDKEGTTDHVGAWNQKERNATGKTRVRKNDGRQGGAVRGVLKFYARNHLWEQWLVLFSRGNRTRFGEGPNEVHNRHYGV